MEYTGLSLQKSTNGGASFASATGGITGIGFAFIAPFAMNQGNKQQLWIGGFDIWRTTNQATSWSRATGLYGTCGLGSVSAIATHPLDGNRVLVGMSDGCYHTTAPRWAPIMGTGSTALPQIPANSVVANPAASNQVFVGTDLGVFTSIDGGASWYRENTGFANVVVDWLSINETAPYKLFAFTHGRGAWVTELATPSAAAATAKKSAGAR